jgi:hypothetical protein
VGRNETTAKDSPPIVWLARLGAAFVVLQAYIYLRWISSDKFTSTPTGPDKIPGATMTWIRVWEVITVVGGVIFLGWLVRRALRDRALSPLGIYVLAWLLTAWQDPGVNLIRPVFAYNSGFFDRGTWAYFIPGWVSKGAENPQPIIYTFGNYMVLMPLAVVGLDSLIATARRRMPRLNGAGVVAALFVSFFVLDTAIEQLFLRMGLWTYPRVDHRWSVFSGTMNQFPLYEGLAFGGIVSVIGIVIYCFRNAEGHMITDRGIGDLQGKRGVGAARVLALAAVLNIVMLVFNMGFNIVNQHANTTPTHVPSYFSNDMCGIGADPPCP